MSICDNPFPSLTSCFLMTHFIALISHKFPCVIHPLILCVFLYLLFMTVILHFVDLFIIVFIYNIELGNVMSFWWTQLLIKTHPFVSWASSTTAQFPSVFLPPSTWIFSTACARRQHHSHSQWTCSLHYQQALYSLTTFSSLPVPLVFQLMHFISVSLLGLRSFV